MEWYLIFVMLFISALRRNKQMGKKENTILTNIILISLLVLVAGIVIYLFLWTRFVHN